MEVTESFVENFDKGLNAPPNPLVIPNIVEHVLSFLGVEEVEKCREVCVTWNLEACHLLRRTKTLKISTPSRMKTYLQLMRAVPVNEFPHNRFQLENIQLTLPLTPLEEPLHHTFENAKLDTDEVHIQFFNTLGRHITSLDITTDFVCSSTHMRRILFDWLPNLTQLSTELSVFGPNRMFSDLTEDQIPKLPKMKSIHIRNSFKHSSDHSGRCLRKLLLATPNVQTLATLQGLDSYSHQLAVSKAVFSALVLSPNPPTLNLLANLNMDFMLCEFEVAALAEKTLPIKSLSLLLRSDVAGGTLDKLMATFSKTLEKLCVRFKSNSPASTFAYTTKLNSLKSLSITEYKGCLNLIRNYPNLVELRAAKLNLDEAFADSSMKTHNLKTLIIERIRDPINMRRIAALFPKLLSLAIINGSNAVLHIVYELMPQLQELALILGKYVTDQGITGIPDQIILDCVNVEALEDPERVRTHLSLSSLPNLTKLHVALSRITDFSVFFGISSCNNLQSVTLNSPRLTDAALRQVVDSLPHLNYFDASSCDRITMDGRMYIKSFMAGKSYCVCDLMMDGMVYERRHSYVCPLRNHKLTGWKSLPEIQRILLRDDPLIEDPNVEEDDDLYDIHIHFPLDAQHAPEYRFFGMRNRNERRRLMKERTLYRRRAEAWAGLIRRPPRLGVAEQRNILDQRRNLLLQQVAAALPRNDNVHREAERRSVRRRGELARIAQILVELRAIVPEPEGIEQIAQLQQEYDRIHQRLEELERNQPRLLDLLRFVRGPADRNRDPQGYAVADLLRMARQRLEQYEQNPLDDNGNLLEIPIPRPDRILHLLPQRAQIQNDPPQPAEIQNAPPQPAEIQNNPPLPAEIQNYPAQAADIQNDPPRAAAVENVVAAQLGRIGEELPLNRIQQRFLDLERNVRRFVNVDRNEGGQAGMVVADRFARVRGELNRLAQLNLVIDQDEPRQMNVEREDRIAQWVQLLPQPGAHIILRRMVRGEGSHEPSMPLPPPVRGQEE